MQESEETDIAGYLDMLYDNRRLIIAATLILTLLGSIYAFIARPVYEASMLIHVEERSSKDNKNILAEMDSLFDYKTAATAEMELVKSRLVVSRAVDKMRLYIGAQPKYFPVIGKWLARRNKGLSSPGVFGHGGYAWGAEKIDVPVFNVPDALLDTEFTLTSLGNGQYRLQLPEKDVDVTGKVGVPLEAQTDKGRVELRVNQITANSGTDFVLTRASRLGMIEKIQNKMEVAEQGRQSGVISVSLQGSDPAMTAGILTEIAKEYTRQNEAHKVEEAERSLSYLNQQLPQLKQELEQSEAKLNEFRNTHGTIDLGEEAKLSLQQSASAKMRKLDLEQKRTELLSRFTENHPFVIAVNNQIAEVNREIKQTADHIRTLPLLEQDILRLNRDVKVNTDLYTALANTAQQLKLITAAKSSNVRLVDMPMTPDEPVAPNRPKIVALSLLGGLFLGVFLAFARKALRRGIDDPTEIEKMLGVPVYAAIPHSKTQKDMFAELGGKSRRLPLLAKVSSTDAAIESLRNFRAAMLHTLEKSKNNIVLIAGPTQGMGKTFVSVNLAAIMAASGKRVLLIDGDFRNGHLHRYFDLGRQNGFSDFITGACRADQVVHRGVVENMDFISTGTLPPNPSELLLRPVVGTLLNMLSAQYDLVLIDGTPILPVADSLILGAHAASIYVITRAGTTTPGEISESLKRLHQAGLATKGVLFNDLETKPGRYGYGYTYGRYHHTQHRLDPPLIEASAA